MTVFRGDENRTMIPRWRAWKITRQSNEILPLTRRGEGALTSSGLSDAGRLDEMERRAASFVANPGVHSAADLVGTALSLDLTEHESVANAANLLCDHPDAPVNSRRMAERVLGIDGRDTAGDEAQPGAIDIHEVHARAARLRMRTRREPSNAICWADLAHAQTTSGSSSAAVKSMRVALALAPTNRFILRAAARLHLHRDDFGQAHDLLARSPRRLHDPWILAAEIATANLAKLPIMNVRAGRQMLESGFEPVHISELASALATLELQAGNVKKAKKFLKQALEKPTENAVAQAEWSAARGLDIVEPEQLKISRGYEARALHARRTGNFHEAMRSGLLWLEDQPFAVDPATFTSYIAALLLEDYDTAIAACELGRIANPDEPILINNLAYSLACSGQPEKALEVINKYSDRLSPREFATMTATRGLIAYRLGDLHKGRQLYEQAIRTLPKDLDRRVVSVAVIMWACEEVRSKGDLSVPLLQAAQRVFEEAGDDTDISFLSNRLARAIGQAKALKS